MFEALLKKQQEETKELEDHHDDGFDDVSIIDAANTTENK
jgi:hypothetical protein